ncbi:MAG TPA: hypothetical protein VIT65_23210 [Microlunatus sp.]
MSDGMLNDPDFKAFAAEVHAHLIPMIMGSSASISLLPQGEADVKYAIELGLTLMLDKPLIIIAPKGRVVPERLARAADAVLEIDWEDEAGFAAAQEQIMVKVKEILGEDEEEHDDQRPR